jgi:hypothetical protein
MSTCDPGSGPPPESSQPPRLRLIPAPDRKPCCCLTRRRAGVLLGVVIGAVLLSLLAQKAGWGHKATKPLPDRVDFIEAVPATLQELDDAIYLYVMFFAIEHDGWLASEASMVATSIEISGLPVKEHAPDLLDSLPNVKKLIGKDIGHIRLLDSPAADMMETGIVLYPKEGRACLLQGRTYTQDGYGGVITHLEGVATCQFTVDLRFLAGDYGDPGDLDNYWIRLAGILENGRVSLRSAGGNIGSPEKVQALLAASKLFEQVSAAKTYKFDSDDEARRVQGLARKVAADVSGIDIRRSADGYIASDNTQDVAILLSFDRYARIILQSD